MFDNFFATMDPLHPATMNPNDPDSRPSSFKTLDKAKRRFRASDQEKHRQADDLKQRFARYSAQTSRVAWLQGPGPRWGRWALAALIVAYLLWVAFA